MRASKQNIIEYLHTIKPQLQSSGIKSLALFGSFAKDTPNVYSDIDIAIAKKDDFLEHNTSYDYFNILSNIKTKIKNQFHRNIDIFDLDSNSSLKASISKDLIYV